MTINIKKRLHHRSPYLLVDEVLEHSNLMIHTKKVANLEEFFVKGHFPNAPIIPGAILQEITTQTAGLLIAEYYSPVPDYDSDLTKGHALGVLRSVHHAKYKSFARPGHELFIKAELIQRIDNAFRFKAQISVDHKVIMLNEFTLVNITDDQLIHGTPN